MNCRLTNALEWKIRCVHEAKLYDANCFVTLTYDDDHLPKDKSVSKRHIQLFMKRLRYETGAKLRYFACGEYGDKTYRAHYHLLIFGYDFPDRYIWRKPSKKKKYPDYRSNELEKVWTQGNAELSILSPVTAGYATRYVTKKQTPDKTGLITVMDPETGTFTERQPAFLLSSRRPALGIAWLEKNFDDVYPADFVVIDGKRYPVPPSYDNYLKIFDEEMYEDVKQARYVRYQEYLAKHGSETEKRLLTKHKHSIKYADRFAREPANVS